MRRQDDRRRHATRRSTIRVDALRATLALQRALRRARRDRRARAARALRVHAGVVERRDNDYFGTRRQPRRAHHERRARRPGARCRRRSSIASRDRAAGRRRRCATSAACACATCDAGARLPARASGRCATSFPALRSLEATPNNLPQQVTSFVGRERELRRAQALLAQHAAADAARHGRPRQDAPVAAGRGRRARRLSATACGSSSSRRSPTRRWCRRRSRTVLGVQEEAGPAADRRRCASIVRDAPAAAVLDNCEHLHRSLRRRSPTRCCARCRDVRILATSREPLRVAGEHDLPGAAAAVPRRARPTPSRRCRSSKRCGCSSSARGRSSPAFALTDANAPAVAELCRAPRRHPARARARRGAACARCRSTTIAARLNDRFRLLTGGEPHRAAAPADAARAGRLELRPAAASASSVLLRPRCACSPAASTSSRRGGLRRGSARRRRRARPPARWSRSRW